MQMHETNTQYEVGVVTQHGHELSYVVSANTGALPGVPTAAIINRYTGIITPLNAEQLTMLRQAVASQCIADGALGEAHMYQARSCAISPALQRYSDSAGFAPYAKVHAAMQSMADKLAQESAACMNTLLYRLDCQMEGRTPTPPLAAMQVVAYSGEPQHGLAGAGRPLGPMQRA